MSCHVLDLRRDAFLLSLIKPFQRRMHIYPNNVENRSGYTPFSALRTKYGVVATYLYDKQDTRQEPNKAGILTKLSWLHVDGMPFKARLALGNLGKRLLDLTACSRLQFGRSFMRDLTVFSFCADGHRVGDVHI